MKFKAIDAHFAQRHSHAEQNSHQLASHSVHPRRSVADLPSKAVLAAIHAGQVDFGTIRQHTHFDHVVRVPRHSEHSHFDHVEVEFGCVQFVSGHGLGGINKQPIESIQVKPVFASFFLVRALK